MLPGPRPTAIRYQLSGASYIIDPCSRLATIDMGRKLRALFLFLGVGSWVPVLYNVCWVEAYLHTKWHLNPSSRLRTIDMGRKLRGCGSCLGRGDWSPSSTIWSGPRPTSIPSGILIHVAVWPQYIDMGLPPFRGGELGPHLRQCDLGRGLRTCQVSS